MPSSSDPATGRRPVLVLAKVGEVLSLLAAEGPLGAPAIAERVDEPRSSVYRLLRTLRRLGYVDSPRRGEFRLGMRLFKLGAGVAARFNVRDAAQPSMQRLHEEAQETTLLFVRREDNAVCIERLDGRWVRLEIVDVGGSLPLHSGAAPRTLLAYAGQDVIDDYLEDARLEPDTERSPTTPREVRRLLGEIRATGRAISDQDLAPGVASVAAPIRDDSGAVVAAMSYSGMASVLLAPAERERSIALVVAAAEEASRRLGYVPEPAVAGALA